MKTILCIDDDLRHCEMIRTSLPGYRVLLAGSGSEGSTWWLRRSPDLVLLDLLLPDMHGLDLLDRFSGGQEDSSPVLVITGMGDPHIEKEAMRRGAGKVLRKPVSRKVLQNAVAGMVEQNHSGSLDRASMRKPHATPVAHDTTIVGESESLIKAKKLAERYAQTDYQVLITGESGTGKELFARYIHNCSKRGTNPLFSVNCASIPDSVAESELFGCERGAYTGAVSRPGLFERASGGTLFLDEIGDLSPAIQAKLLRVIETGTVSRLGGQRERGFDVRFISATNRDLQSLVREGIFREDLFYRLSCLDLELPPLRERPEDVVSIVGGVLKRGYSITDPALAYLCYHPWPGNVRQLINTVKKVMVLSGEERLITEEQISSIEKRGSEKGKRGKEGASVTKQLLLFKEINDHR